MTSMRIKWDLSFLPAMLICSSLLRPILFRLKCFLPISLRRWCRLREQPIGEAIRLAMNSFTPDESADKAIIVITDGENHEDDAVAMAKEAAKRGIKVDVIGIGSSQGSPIIRRTA